MLLPLIIKKRYLTVSGRMSQWMRSMYMFIVSLQFIHIYTQFILYYYCSLIVKLEWFACVNQTRIRSMKQAVLNNECQMSCSRKQQESLIGFELMTYASDAPPTAPRRQMPHQLLHGVRSPTHCATWFPYFRYGISYIVQIWIMTSTS